METKNIRSNSSTHLSYGIETPELLGALAGISLFLLAAALIADKVQLRWLVAGFLGALFCLISLFLILLAVWLGWSYFLGKGRSSQQVLAALRLKGKEKLLDLGCGRGLILIEAAKKITKGKCVGLDDWSQKDFYSNNAEKTMENAATEGVAKKVQVVPSRLRSISKLVSSPAPSVQAKSISVDEAAVVVRPVGAVAHAGVVTVTTLEGREYVFDEESPDSISL